MAGGASDSEVPDESRAEGRTPARHATPVPDAPGQCDVAVIGAGPCGLAAAIEAERAGLRTLTFDRGTLVSGIAGYPVNLTFFSTAERIAIADVPFVVAGEKPTRRDALAYSRMVATRERVPLRLYETVDEVCPTRADDLPMRGRGWRQDAPGRARPVRFLVRSRTVPHGAARLTFAHAVVIATGYFGRPNLLGVPGEELPHVTHFFREGHDAYDRDVVVVGGGNSAVDAALELYRSGARVTIAHFRDALDPNVKPWVRPDIEARIREGSIAARFGVRVARVTPDHVVLRDAATGAAGSGGAGAESSVRADQVYAMTGFLPNTALLERLGVPLDPTTGVPAHDPATMETTIPGVFIAGVLASGLDANKIFIENGRGHGALIARRLAARAAG